MTPALYINVHGIRILINSQSQSIHEWLKFDFAKCNMDEFSEAPDIDVSVISSSASDAPVPAVSESSHTPEYVTYSENGIKYIDYYGRVVAVYNSRKESAVFYSTEDHYLYEKVYLFILSRLGEMLDFRGLHRIHALGFTYKDNGFLYLIPMKGGKSTLALSLCTKKDFTLSSDDAPLINHQGEIVPFPFRLGVREGESLQGIPLCLTRLFIRKNRESKVLIHPDAVTSWTKSPTKCHAIFIGRWTKAQSPQICDISAFRLWKMLFRDCVIGLGLPQVVEFFIKSSFSDVFQKIFLVAFRTAAITKLALHARGYEFQVTSDLDLNRDMLIAKLNEISSRC